MLLIKRVAWHYCQTPLAPGSVIQMGLCRAETHPLLGTVLIPWAEGGLNIPVSSDKEDRNFPSAEQSPTAEYIHRLSGTGGVSLGQIQQW